MTCYPDSVFEFGSALRARPWVKRVKLDAATFERYVQQLLDNRQVVSADEAATPIRMFSWRNKQAVIVDHAWSIRRDLWPVRLWRRT